MSRSTEAVVRSYLRLYMATLPCFGHFQVALPVSGLDSLAQRTQDTLNTTSSCRGGEMRSDGGSGTARPGLNTQARPELVHPAYCRSLAFVLL